MKTIKTLLAAVIIASGSTLAHAAECSGTVDVSDLELGCNDEATKIVSLAKCDYRADKDPNISLYNVIDGQWGNQSVTVLSTRPGSFTVRIAPNNGDDDTSNSCKVERFSWSAD